MGDANCASAQMRGKMFFGVKVHDCIIGKRETDSCGYVQVIQDHVTRGKVGRSPMGVSGIVGTFYASILKQRNSEMVSSFELVS